MKATLALVLIALIGISTGVYSARISVDDFTTLEKSNPRNAKFIEVYEKVLELREREASKRSLEQTECRVPTGLVFCTNVNYASTTDPATEQYFISLLNETFSENPDCNEAFKNLYCSILFRGCDYGGPGGAIRNLPTCRSQCIDFTTKCAAFYTGGICTDPRSYSPDDNPDIPCTRTITPPLPTCSFPAFDLGACSAYVTYTTPTGPNPEVNELMQGLTASYFLFVNYTIQAALTESLTTPAQGELCYQAYQRMLCRYIFLECTGGDPFRINFNCDLTCQDLYFACPFMRPSDYEPPTGDEIDDSCGLVLPGCKPLPVGFTYGDPHFQTLDGAPFEFNGLGEFTIAQSTDSDAVEVQARFEKCNSNTDATCTTAAAVTGYSHSVRLYSSGSTVSIRVDSTTLAIDSTQFPYSVGGGEIVISRESGTLNFEVAAQNGLSLQYRLQEGFTMIAVGAGSGLKGKLKGFYGNFDGLRANDFETKDGTIINFPATAPEIFTWGRTWRVSEANSAFDYDGTTYAAINDDTFVPSFSDNGMTFSSQATTACEGLGDQFYRSCLFDVTVSGDANFARASIIAQDRIQQLSGDGSQAPTAEEPVAESSASVQACFMALLVPALAFIY